MTHKTPLYDSHTTLCTHIPCYAHITDNLNHIDKKDFDTQQS